MRRLRHVCLPLLLLTPAACVSAPENGTITDADVSSYVVEMTGFTTTPGRTVQMEVLSPPDQDPLAATSTWVPLGDPVVSASTPFGYGYDNLFVWSASASLSEAGPVLTWRDEGLLRVRAREVESNGTLITVDDFDCLLEHLGDPVLDVVSACRSEYSGVLTILSEVNNAPLPAVPFLSLKSNTQLVGNNFYSKFGYGAPGNLLFGEWLDSHHFSSNNTVHAEYFNGVDLGMGRDMNCRHVYADEEGEVCFGNSSGAGELLRTACYVTNYGDPGSDPADAFADMDAHQAFATVAMEKHYHPPGLADCASTLAAPVPAEDDVRFFVWGHFGTPPDEFDGAQANAKLDSGTAKPTPGICLNCHGGNVDNGAVVGAKFLPFDIDLFQFDDAISGSEADQLEAFRELNAIVVDTEQEGAPDSEPASELARLVMTWYGGVPTSGDAAVRTAGTPYDGDARPDAWLDPYDPTNDYGYQHELYKDVIRPYCRMCHIAFEDNYAPQVKDITFASPQSYDASAYTAASYVCNGFVMPHAEVTADLFWDSNARMIVINEGGLDSDCTPYTP